MKLIVIAIAASAIMTGCAQMEMKDSLAACKANIAAAEISVLRGKIPLEDTERPTIAMLNDPKKATEEDQKAIINMDRVLIECAKSAGSVAQKYNAGDYLALIMEIAAAGQSLRADLYSGKISYGEYNRKSEEMKAAFTRRGADLDARRQAQASSSIMATAQTLQTLQQMQPRPVATPPSLPTRTNCQTYGVQTNCTTW